mgnify:CR=1 FL=1
MISADTKKKELVGDFKNAGREWQPPGTPEVAHVHDFPGGAGRFVQRGNGYDATIVNGRVFMRGGEPTGELAGTVLRSGPPTA